MNGPTRMTKDKPPPAMPKQNTIDKYANMTTATPDMSGLGSGKPNNAMLLAAITQSRDMVDGKTGAVGLDINLLRQDLMKAVKLITKTETRVSSIKDSIMTLQQNVNTLTVVTKKLAQ
ncbi:hypothetical protein NDU88_003416 [Pleurodeles waltl]|uniref:Uncharacterized protein n=1 Tax=Pleurodeles waltl TaxID=8319 RepID=A0AAV7LFS3_PLEWA|nr:hypothetical protein NDU88_003416 [Pleurodeles waltl]